MKLSEMTSEQQEEKRKYDREAKQHQRAKEKTERMLRIIPNARDYRMPEEQQNKLGQHTHIVTKTVAAELGVEKLSDPDQYITAGVASVVFGLENQVTQIVYQPNGMLVGGWFPDAAASEAIEHVHRFPSLLQSTTFTDLYSKFLQAVVKWSKKNEQCSTHEFIQEIQAEIGGEYVLPQLLELPKAEPKPEAPPVPSDAETLKRGRIQLLNQLSVQDPNLSPDARRYLDGTV